MIKPDPFLEPDWDEENVDHIARHGLRPEQVEELYYGEGPYLTLVIKNKVKGGRGEQEDEQTATQIAKPPQERSDCMGYFSIRRETRRGSRSS